MEEVIIVMLQEEGETVSHEIRNENEEFLSDHDSLDEAVKVAIEYAEASVHFIEHIKIEIEPEAH